MQTLQSVFQGSLGYSLLGLLAVGVLLLAAASFFYWWIYQRKARSPFTGKKLLPATCILYPAAEKIALFMQAEKQVPIDWEQATFCPDTRRIFPKSLNQLGAVALPSPYWRGVYDKPSLTAWLFLTDEQKDEMFQLHGAIKGFQLGHQKRPGPLFVDLKSKTLVGWKQVPDTDIEVLIVHYPEKRERE